MRHATGQSADTPTDPTLNSADTNGFPVVHERPTVGEERTDFTRSLVRTGEESAPFGDPGRKKPHWSVKAWNLYFHLGSIFFTSWAFYHNYLVMTGQSNYRTVSELVLYLTLQYPILPFGLAMIMSRPKRFNRFLRHNPWWGIWYGIVIGHIFWPIR